MTVGSALADLRAVTSVDGQRWTSTRRSTARAARRSTQRLAGARRQPAQSRPAQRDPRADAREILAAGPLPRQRGARAVPRLLDRLGDLVPRGILDWLDDLLPGGRERRLDRARGRCCGRSPGTCSRGVPHAAGSALRGAAQALAARRAGPASARAPRRRGGGRAATSRPRCGCASAPACCGSTRAARSSSAPRSPPTRSAARCARRTSTRSPRRSTTSSTAAARAEPRTSPTPASAGPRWSRGRLSRATRASASGSASLAAFCSRFGRAARGRPALAGAEGPAVVLVRDVAAGARRLRRRCSSAPGHPVRRLRTPIADERRRATGETLVVLDPDVMEPEEARAIGDWVRGGGRLVAGGTRRRPWLDERARRARPTGTDGGRERRRTLVPVAETAGVTDGARRDGGGWHDLGGALPLIGPAGRAAARHHRAAAGERQRCSPTRRR